MPITQPPQRQMLKCYEVGNFGRVQGDKAPVLGNLEQVGM